MVCCDCHVDPDISPWPHTVRGPQTTCQDCGSGQGLTPDQHPQKLQLSLGPTCLIARVLRSPHSFRRPLP